MQFGHLAFGQSAMKTMIDQIFWSSCLRSIRTDLLSWKVAIHENYIYSQHIKQFGCFK